MIEFTKAEIEELYFEIQCSEIKLLKTILTLR